ncbi:hypothetical protein FRC08_016442 [Ceratobasidium sp. 394]|nr:hypothetical protein FRC08_016442 [Ceratobasidium sp. 394]
MVCNEAKLTLGGITVGIGTADDDDHYIQGFDHHNVKFPNVPYIIHARECFIPVVAGQKFCIHVSYAPGGSRVKGAGIQAEVYLEGACAAHVFWPAQDFKRGRCEFEITDFPVGEEVCTLRFSQRKLTEDKPPEDEEPDKWWLGTVAMRVYWAFEDKGPETEDQVDENKVENMLYEKKLTTTLNQPLNERDGGAEYDLGIEYAPHKKRETPEQGDETLYKVQKTGDKEFHFIFSYRKRDWMVAEGIAPRTLLPSLPTPGPSGRSPSIKREESDTPPLSKKPTRASKRTRRN